VDGDAHGTAAFAGRLPVGRVRQMLSTPIHRRSYDCQAFSDGAATMLIRGRLTDTKPLGLGPADGEPLVIHDMSIELTVSVPGFEIVAVEAVMHVHPYELCTAVLPDYQQLVGLSIARGYSRRVRELFGGPNGCSHIGALLQALGPVAIQASWSLLDQDEDQGQPFLAGADPEERARRLRFNANTCHVWAEGGQQMVAIESGRAPMRPDWERERRSKLGLDADRL
jgi:hypothetical protein